MTKSRLHIALLVALILGLFVPLSVGARGRVLPSRETVEMVKREVANMRQMLPFEGGVGMIVSDVAYDEASYTINYRYIFTLSVDPNLSDAQVNAAKNLAIAVAKADPAQKSLLEQGITFHYDYYSLFDELLYSIDITPEDIAEADYVAVQDDDVPDFAGDWESTNPDFQLTLSIDQHSGVVDVIECQIYRTYAWEPTGRIEGGKLILDDPDSEFPFHAEFTLRDGRLTGPCRAFGGPRDTNFSGILTLKSEAGALPKLQGYGGTYRYTENHYIDGENVTYSLEVGLQGGPQYAVCKVYTQDSHVADGVYEIDGYDIVIRVNDGALTIPGHFSEDLSMLYLTLDGRKYALRRTGPFHNW